MFDLGKWLMLAGAVCLFFGGLIWLFGKFGIPLGQLPGDVRVSGEKYSFYFPVVTSIVLSIILTIVINVILSFFRK